MTDWTGAIWQIVGAAAGRPYAEEMVRYGVMLVGPGDRGPWASPQFDDDSAVRETLRWFAESAAVGDAVVLRTGRSAIRAVGLIAGAYEYSERFDDVNGLDRQHSRRIRWFDLPAVHEFETLVFGQQPATFSRVRSDVVRGVVAQLLGSEPVGWQIAPLPALPPEEPPLERIPPKLAALVGQAQDLLPLYGDNERFGSPPTEDEMVAHYVVPFLRDFGWPPELVGVKWRNVDVALFSSLPRSFLTCELVIEAKRLGVGVEAALHQAQGYVEGLALAADVAVTDGIRWRRYSRAQDFAPSGYANLARLKARAVTLFDTLQGPRWSA